MKKIILLIIVAAALGTWSASMARAQDQKLCRLTVVQDESSMEKIIEQYLIANHKMIVTEKTKGDDLWLELPMKGETTPAFTIFVDTQPLNKNDAAQVVERGIIIQAQTRIKVPADRRAAVMRIINDFNRNKAFAAAYVDSDGEILLSWILNVLDPAGLDAEYVYDVVAREDMLWRQLYPLVKPAME